MVARVFLLDDHELIRQALRETLLDEPDLEVAGEASTAADGLAAMLPDPPDVAVVDVRLPDGDGIDVCRTLRSRHPETRCLILTSEATEDAVVKALLAGAAGFLVKDARRQEIVEAIRHVARGGSLLDRVATTRVLARLREGSQEASHLTSQEEKLLDLLGEGLTNRQIAERMSLSEKTVRNYMSRLLGKLGMRHRTEAALFAHRRRRRS